MKQHDPLKFLIVVYVLLLLFEGALRKWVLPGLSGPLLLVRDPIAAFIIFYALATRRVKIDGYLSMLFTLMVLFVLLGFYQFGEGLSTGVFFFGMRTYFLHLPLVFVIARVLTHRDVLWIGKIFLILAVPMTVLMVRQFQAGPDSGLNVGAGGTIGGQIESAMGKIRPSGTFSYSTGPTAYYSIVVAYLLYAFYRRGGFQWWLVWPPLVATVAVAPVSGSRSLVLGAIVTALMGLAGGGFKSRGLVTTAKLAVVVVGIFYILTFFSFFEEGSTVFSERWEMASDASGGAYESIVPRFVSTITRPFEDIAAGHAKIFGDGIGMGTQAAARLTTGRAAFLLAEDDLQRILMEVGLILGLSYIALRTAIVARQGTLSLANARRGYPLAWFIFAATFLNTFIGQMGQATNLGFIAVGAGLGFAALKERDYYTALARWRKKHGRSAQTRSKGPPLRQGVGPRMNPASAQGFGGQATNRHESGEESPEVGSSGVGLHEEERKAGGQEVGVEPRTPASRDKCTPNENELGERIPEVGSSGVEGNKEEHKG